MKLTNSDPLLQALARLRELFPEQRLGQLVANLTTAAGCEEAGGDLGRRGRATPGRGAAPHRKKQGPAVGTGLTDGRGARPSGPNSEAATAPHPTMPAAGRARAALIVATLHKFGARSYPNT